MRGPVWPSMVSSTRCDLSCEIGFGFSWSIPTRQPSDNCSRASSAKVDALGCHSLVSPIRCIHLLPEIQSEQNLREPFDGGIRQWIRPSGRTFWCGSTLATTGWRTTRYEAPMAVPKRRISKTRGRKRRTHIRARSIQVVVCKECHLSIPSHAVCPRCGHYARFSQPMLPSDD